MLTLSLLQITLTSETGNMFSLQTVLTNTSQEYMKDYDTSITMTVLDRHVSYEIFFSNSDIMVLVF